MREHFTLFTKDADLWEEAGMTLADEDAMVLALWRWYRGRPITDGLSVTAKVLYSSITSRLEASEPLYEARSHAGKKGAISRWGLANGKTDGNPDSKANGKSDGKTDSKGDGKANSKVIAEPKWPTATATATSTSTATESESAGDARAPAHARVSESQLVERAKTTMGIPEWYARWWYREMTIRAWQTSKGGYITNANIWSQLQSWWRRTTDEEREGIRAEAETAAPKPRREYTLKDWGLCDERCGNFVNGRCRAGGIIPPQLQERPIPPEECSCFKRKDNN